MRIPTPGAVARGARRPAVWIPVLLFVAGMVITRRAWGGVAPGGDDVPYHLSRAVFAWRHIFPAGHLDGWSPRFGAGSQAFLVYGPGLAFTYAAVKVVTLGRLADGATMAAVMTVSYALVGPAVWFLARSFRLSPAAAGIAGAVGLCVSVPFGVGVAGTFDLGLAGNGVAAPLFCVALGLIVRLVDRPGSTSVRLTAVVVAALVVTHPLSVVLLGLTLAVILPFCWLRAARRWSSFRRLAAAGLAAVGLIGWWLVPLALRHSPRGPLSDWGTPPFWTRVNELVRGTNMFAPVVAAVMVVAFVALVVQLNWRSSPAWDQAAGPGLVLAPLLLVPIASAIRDQWGQDSTVNMIPNRILGYVGFLAALVVGQFVAGALRVLLDREWFGLAAVGVLGITVAVTPAVILRDDQITHVDALPVRITEVSAVLRAQLRPWSRFVFDDGDTDFRNSFGIVHPEMWLSEQSDRNTVADLGGNSVSGFDNYLQDHLFDQSPAVVTARLADAGVTVLVVGAAHQGEAARWPGWVQEWTGDGVWVFRRVESRGTIAPDALLVADRAMDASLLAADPERIRWSVRTTAPTSVTIAVASFGKWHLHLGDTEVPVHDTDGLITAVVPAGSGALELTYDRDLGDLAGLVLSLGTVVVLAASPWLRPRLRRTRSTGEGAAAGAPLAPDAPEAAIRP